jgi:hypothetical protein
LLFLLLDGCRWGLVSLGDSWWVVVFVAVFSGGREGLGLGIVELGGRLTGFCSRCVFDGLIFVCYLPLFFFFIESWNVFVLF